MVSRSSLVPQRVCQLCALAGLALAWAGCARLGAQPASPGPPDAQPASPRDVLLALAAVDTAHASDESTAVDECPPAGSEENRLIRGVARQVGLGDAYARPPDLEEPAPEVTAELDACARALFDEALVPSANAWRVFRLAPDSGAGQSAVRSTHAARAQVSAELSVAGAVVRLDGLIFRTDYAAGLLLHADTGTEVALHERVPEVAVRWPAGVMGCGRSFVSDEGTGSRFAYALASDDAQPSRLDDVHPAVWWPFRVSCWSDGEWVALSVPLTTESDAERPTEPSVRPFRAGQSAQSTGGRLQAEQDGGRTSSLRAVQRLTNATLAGRSASGGDTDDCLAEVQPFLSGLDELRVGLLDGADWAEASVEPAPDSVRRYAGLPDDTHCLTVRKPRHAADRALTAGLLEMDDLTGGIDGGLVEGPRLVQWTLGGDWLSITVVSRQAPRLYGWVNARCAHLPSEKRMLTQELTHCLGAYGRSLTLVPVDIQEGHAGRGLLVTPRPDTPYGLYGESTVGEQPWGRCRIYVDPAILHIVFDLPEEEGGAE